MRNEVIHFLKNEARPGLIKTGPISAMLSRGFEGDTTFLVDLLDSVPEIDKYLLSFHISDSNPLFKWEASSFLRVKDFRLTLTISQVNNRDCVGLLKEGEPFPPENLARCLVDLLSYKTAEYSQMLTSLEPLGNKEWTVSGFNEDVLTIIRNLKVLHVEKAYRDWKVPLNVHGKDEAAKILEDLVATLYRLGANLITLTVGQSDFARRIIVIFVKDDFLITLDIYVRI